jgi:hypothetical protein
MSDILIYDQTKNDLILIGNPGGNRDYLLDLAGWSGLDVIEKYSEGKFYYWVEPFESAAEIAAAEQSGTEPPPRLGVAWASVQEAVAFARGWVVRTEPDLLSFNWPGRNEHPLTGERRRWKQAWPPKFR